MAEVKFVILCPPPEPPTTDGTRPGPCHIWGHCPDLNPCELRQRCTHAWSSRRAKKEKT